MALLLFYTTHPDEATAKEIGGQLVSERLAACYNLLPMQSGYFWEGAFAKDDEWVLVLKTQPARREALQERLLALHPYEVPCCLHWEVSANPAYEAWIIAETTAA